MKLSQFIEGLQILKPYYKDGDDYHLGAEHDVFYAYGTERPLSAPDVVRMLELGWFQEDAPRDDEGEFTAENYDPEKGWAAFV